MSWLRCAVALAALFAAVAGRAAKLDDGLADAAKVLGTRESRARARAEAVNASWSREASLPLAIMPLVGTTRYFGPAAEYVSAALTTGLALEVPVNDSFSVEIEGGFEKTSLAYATVRPDGSRADIAHGFSRGQLGLGVKSYVARGFLNPYIGAGFHGVRYDGILQSAEVAAPALEQWVGAAQAVAGLELDLSDRLSLGARASFTQPVASLPPVEVRDGRFVAGSEELALTRVGYWRFFGSAKITF